MRFIVYIFLGAGAAIAIVALAVVLLDDGEQARIEPQQDTSGTAVVEAPSAAPQTVVETAPAAPASGAADVEKTPATQRVPVQIDLAQVRPDGNAVFAGKAAPNAKVTVFEGDVVLGTTTADENGEWVVVPEAALGAGEHLVSVGAVSGDGVETVADITMAIQVGKTAAESPLVALLRRWPLFLRWRRGPWPGGQAVSLSSPECRAADLRWWPRRPDRRLATRRSGLTAPGRLPGVLTWTGPAG